MNPIRLLAYAVAFSASLFAQDPAPQPEYVVTGPEELRQHIEPAKSLADRFLAFYDLKNFKAAEKLMWLKNYNLDKVAGGQSAHFGKMLSRELNSITVADSYPPAADAPYIIFRYTSSFEKKKTLPQKIVVRFNEEKKYEIYAFTSDR